MANINAILNQRTKKLDSSSKMAALAKQSTEGQLTSFSGVFSLAKLSEKEKEKIQQILNDYRQDQAANVETDLEALLSITSEVKAIHNQAAILHGERIKKAHDILVHYQDGAFTAWLVATYGNRQTPYNLMQYYEFYEAMPKQLRPQLETMPRQAIYTLASRSGELEKKQEIIRQYHGETKSEMLQLIRTVFPLEQGDKRKNKPGDKLLQSLKSLYEQLQVVQSMLSPQEKNQIKKYLKELNSLVD